MGGLMVTGGSVAEGDGASVGNAVGVTGSGVAETGGKVTGVVEGRTEGDGVVEGAARGVDVPVSSATMGVIVANATAECWSTGGGSNRGRL